MLRRCLDCRSFYHPPRPNCPECASSNLEWVESPGKGKVYTYVITRQPVNPAFRERLPWGVVEVEALAQVVPVAPGREGGGLGSSELEEGVHLISNLVDCDADDIEIGMEVEVVFEAVNDEITLPKFRRVGQ